VIDVKLIRPGLFSLGKPTTGHSQKELVSEHEVWERLINGFGYAEISA
jgi:hypothetical protein